MKNVSRDFSHKKYIVSFINPRTGWSDFSETDNPNARIAKFKADLNVGYARTDGMGDPKDVLIYTVLREESLNPVV